MMISKNSYFNKTFFKNLMKRFWIIGLGMMVSYVLLYLYPIYQGASSEGYQYYAAYLKGSYFIGNLIISTIAILTSVALLYFYHNRTASTIIHSMPIKRSELYWTSFTAGMILMFVPLILTTGILIFYGKTIPLYYRELSINHCLSWFLIQSAIIFFAYGITQFCGIITGNLYTHCILGVFFNCLPWLSSQFFTILKSAFTYGVEEPSAAFENYSTAFNYVLNLEKWLTLRTLAYLTIYIAIGISLVFIAYFIYKRVKLEYIGSFVVFDRLKDIVVIIGTLVLSSFVTFLFISNETSIHTMRITFVIIGIIDSFIGYYISRMIADMTLYVFNKKNFKKFIIYLVVFSLMCVFFVFDITDEENKIPKTGTVSYVTFSSDYSGNQDVRLNDSDSIDIIHDIHKDILKAPHNSNDSSHYFSITYHLVDGKTLTRSYNISQDCFNKYVKDDMKSLYTNVSYMNQIFRNMHWVEVSVMNYTDDTMDDTVYLKEDDVRGLKYALRKDYETLSMDTISDAINNYKYSIEVINDADYVLTFYINKDFENTVTYFKKRGYKLVAKNS